MPSISITSFLGHSRGVFWSHGRVLVRNSLSPCSWLCSSSQVHLTQIRGRVFVSNSDISCPTRMGIRTIYYGGGIAWVTCHSHRRGRWPILACSYAYTETGRREYSVTTHSNLGCGACSSAIPDLLWRGVGRSRYTLCSRTIH